MNNAIQKTYFAGGCFRGVEYHFKRLAGVVSTKVGYMGGNTDKPTYEEVNSHQTGHVEVVEVIFDTGKTSFETLAKLFFEIHDPTQSDGQGPDIGNQYYSIIFYTNQEQKYIAQNLIDTLKGKGYEVMTQLKQSEMFWEAEEYHQNYYNKENKLPYCHIYTKRF